MKKMFSLSVLLFVSLSLFSQQTYKSKKKKKDFFGKETYNNRQVGNFGMHLGAGPSFSLASDNKNQENIAITDANGNAYNYTIDQKGKIGLNTSLGVNYFNKKAGWFSFGRLIDYYELGAGFNYYRGTENTSLTDATGRDLPTQKGEGEFKAGILLGRFGIHKILSIPGTKLFVDNGLALNGEFNLLQASTAYSSFIAAFSKYSPKMTFQANYSLGVGFNLKKGSYLIPTVTIPVFSFKEMGKQAVHWFDSKYYPINVQLKWIYRFSKPKSKTNCTTPDKGPIDNPEEKK